jgi:hypothetical protein
MADNLPFMPEMLRYIGHRFQVDRRAERICDTVHYSGSRRLTDAVYLEDLRCDGASHAGCQAACRLLWKESWLRKIDPSEPRTVPAAAEDLEALRAHIAPHVHRTPPGTPAAEVRWGCQTTDLLSCTMPVSATDLGAYTREVSNGNVSLPRLLRVLAKTAVSEPLRRLGSLWRKLRPHHAPRSTPVKPLLDLQPGEWVRVKSRAAIATTLNATGHHRGLSFDREMMPFCGRIFRVQQRISRIIEEKDGRFIEIHSDCIALEKVFCSGECAASRLFCSRAITPYWRECWLERVEPRPQIP